MAALKQDFLNKDIWRIELSLYLLLLGIHYTKRSILIISNAGLTCGVRGMPYSTSTHALPQVSAAQTSTPSPPVRPESARGQVESQLHRLSSLTGNRSQEPNGGLRSVGF